MKSNNYFLFMLLFVCITVLSSCKKDDEKLAKSKTELLAGATSKTWKITNMEASEMGATISIFSSLPACYRDNITVFYSNKNFEEKEGASKCDSDDLIDQGKWSLSSDEKEITKDYNSYKEVYKVSELSSSTLKLEMVDPDDNQSKIIFTYTAQ